MSTLNIMLANGSLRGGGAEHVIATLARQLRKAGHRVTIAAITSGGEVQENLQADGFEVLTNISEHSSIGILSIAGRLKRIIAARQIQVVHTHDLRSLADVGVCRMVARRFRHLHTFHFGNYPHVPRKQLWLERLFARAANQLVAVGNAQRESIIAALKLPPNSIKTIWNGVDSTSMAASQPATVTQNEDPPLIGSVSAFNSQKGLPTLLRAAAIVRARGLRFRLVLVGGGPMQQELEADVVRLGLADTVTFTGWLPNTESVLRTFDVFVQSSYWEAMSIVILEAMAAGRAILATSVGENPLVLEHEVSAILVPPRDAESLASGLCRLIEDKALRSRLAKAARDAYSANFTAKAMADRYIAAYEQLR